MTFIPYSRQNIQPSDIDAVVEVLQSEYLTQGPAIARFEQAFAHRHSVRHALAVSNATAGLHMACVALGLGPGGLLWTSPLSFVASSNCARYCNAEVDFVDIDPSTRNMSLPALEAKLARAEQAGRLPDVVVPVDFSGLPADLKQIRALADRYGFKILQDASHAAGASYLGAPVGSAWSDITVFSFHAVKIVTTAEGGMVTTQDDALAAKLQLLRSHGITREPALLQNQDEGAWYYEQQCLGWNYRITDIQAALGLSQLERMEDMQTRRVARADRYDRMLAELPVILPMRIDDRSSSWHLYAIEIDEQRTKATRREVFDALRAAQIGANVHYIPIHTQPYYAALGFRPGDFPAAEHYYERALSLPLFPAMTDEEQDRVVDVLKRLLSK
ncbi:UDP-4-amino-4,6-dideoxy-N-acetyl-beta-L-altrosamine transaminase [Herbaspirillum robiniae]|uniref:UDP-4-amino-4, 6-dideoxy-N-acetyl-beta-L-altrosamine transaminase n=1 Tax=Herbaspirillum robiniae TaxID=2014887 RepID=A0ABX2LXH0_9BURK|nr:UDP-4-amino-4,6-dideoxy-N-acetyl-beta-L-altrosamine transaminase [Herbaspirillum robiniae]NUU03185.1 UDP-4-amino-4,6-dideoxy-N-acetyl-beta-L-altrosamine transaminase [Herbaspirillum robiniae]